MYIIQYYQMMISLIMIKNVNAFHYIYQNNNLLKQEDLLFFMMRVQILITGKHKKDKVLKYGNELSINIINTFSFSNLYICIKIVTLERYQKIQKYNLIVIKKINVNQIIIHLSQLLFINNSILTYCYLMKNVPIMLIYFLVIYSIKM